MHLPGQLYLLYFLLHHQKTRVRRYVFTINNLPVCLLDMSQIYLVHNYVAKFLVMYILYSLYFHKSFNFAIVMH